MPYKIIPKETTLIRINIPVHRMLKRFVRDEEIAGRGHNSMGNAIVKLIQLKDSEYIKMLIRESLKESPLPTKSTT